MPKTRPPYPPQLRARVDLPASFGTVVVLASRLRLVPVDMVVRVGPSLSRNGPTRPGSDI